jgi:hypothetical protein
VELLASIFSHLTADEHQRLAVLSKRFQLLVGSNWRAAAAPAAGVPPQATTWALVRFEDARSRVHALPSDVFRALVLRAGPSLRLLDAGTTHAPFSPARRSLESLMRLLREAGACAGLDTLCAKREHAPDHETLDRVEEALLACPALRCLAVDVAVGEDELARLAALCARYPALQCGRVLVNAWRGDEPPERYAALGALLACGARSVRELHLRLDTFGGAAAVEAALEAAGVGAAADLTELHVDHSHCDRDTMLASVLAVVAHPRTRGFAAGEAFGTNVRFAALCAALKRSSLRSLTLACECAVSYDEDVESTSIPMLSDALLAGTRLRRLRHLCLRGAALRSLLNTSGWSCLCASLAELPELESLSLADYDPPHAHLPQYLKAMRMRTLANLLRARPSLRSLHVARVGIGAGGVAALAAGLHAGRGCSQLQRLSLHAVGCGNGGSGGIDALAAAVAHNASLRVLDLHVDAFDDALDWPADVSSYSAVLDALLQNRTLVHVALPMAESGDVPMDLLVEGDAELRLHALAARSQNPRAAQVHWSSNGDARW